MKLGIIGTGTIVQEVLPYLKGWGWETAALCSTERSLPTAKKMARDHGIPLVTSDPEEVLSGELDAVYIALPNHLHASYARMALEHGKNVILEKPMASNDQEARELEILARERELFLFEAISTLYLSVYQKTREWLAEIGEIRLASANFSQYSRRYDAFMRGEILPVFDPDKSGGALMDIGHYNLHYLMGLFGEPRDAVYHPNLMRGIDTSGILTLDYGSFQAVSLAAKDCGAPCRVLIQGTKGYLQMDGPTNACPEVTLHRNDGTFESFKSAEEHRMEGEFISFAREISSGDRTLCYERLFESVRVSEVQTGARTQAGIWFPTDPA